MKIAIFGKKYKNNLSSFRDKARQVLKKYNVNDTDESYFDTSRDEDASKPKETFRSIENILFRSDAVIVESTQHSDGIGIIIGLALGLNKPVLVLYDKIERKDIFSSIAIASSSAKKAMVKGYSMANLENQISEFIERAETQIAAKFYINLAPEINRYLEWWASTHRRAKVDRIRELMLEDIAKNEKWQKLENAD